jgi:hypothetical protein
MKKVTGNEVSHLVSRMLWAKDKVEISYLLWKNIKEAWTFSSINFVALGFYLGSLRNMPTFSDKKKPEYNEILLSFSQ